MLLRKLQQTEQDQIHTDFHLALQDIITLCYCTEWYSSKYTEYTRLLLNLIYAQYYFLITPHVIQRFFH